MIKWILTGFLLLRLWTARVGVWDALRGCVWVVARKALPGQKGLAAKLMPRPRILEIQIPGHAHPFYARWPASDVHILYAIVTRGEYASVKDYLDTSAEVLFLDIGANIGAASRYFLETFPRSRVIAVEPDAGNAAMCHKNLDPYGDRARVIQGAVWNRTTPLIFDADWIEIGVEAGVRVREPIAGEDLSTSIAAFDVPTLLADAHISADTLVALKIDVEGSEEEIFDGTNLDWLDGVSCIAIELHDMIRPHCSRNFYAAVKGRLVEPPKKLSETDFVHLKVRAKVGTPA